VIFATLEDETGIANIVIWPKVFEANRKIVLGARLLGVRGRLQREGLVIHIIAEQLTDLTPQLLEISNGVDLGDTVLARADEGKSGPHGSQSRDRNAVREIELARRRAYTSLPSGRNFH
jgi:DNA polymerase III alpha subunit